jgi:hypothetical protein
VSDGTLISEDAEALARVWWPAEMGRNPHYLRLTQEGGERIREGGE